MLSALDVPICLLLVHAHVAFASPLNGLLPSAYYPESERISAEINHPDRINQSLREGEDEIPIPILLFIHGSSFLTHILSFSKLVIALRNCSCVVGIFIFSASCNFFFFLQKLMIEFY